MMYNRSCCNGNITLGLSQLVSGCCESEAYNPLNQICCDGHILTRNSARAKCCGSGIYLPTTHLCCNNRTIKLTDRRLACCGSESYDEDTQCCCVFPNRKVKSKSADCCGNYFKDPSQNNIRTCEKTNSALGNSPQGLCPIRTKTLASVLKCGSKSYKRSPLNQCCGEDVYSLSNDQVLCCNGILHHNLPDQSECVGGVIFTPANAKHHIKLNCGSEVYDPHDRFLKCCSGRLYNITHLTGKAECCGPLLLVDENTQTCCSSASQALLYTTKPEHLCCGHNYFNMSLWSCCAGHLKPRPNTYIPAAWHRLKPLMDLIPGICNKTVFFGKVENVVLNHHHRLVVLRVVVRFKVKFENETEDHLLHVSLDHCSSPALEIGMTYLWWKNNETFMPLSVSVDPTFDVHMFFTVCYETLVQA